MWTTLLHLGTPTSEPQAIHQTGGDNAIQAAFCPPQVHYLTVLLGHPQLGCQLGHGTGSSMGKQF